MFKYCVNIPYANANISKFPKLVIMKMYIMFSLTLDTLKFKDCSTSFHKNNHDKHYTKNGEKTEELFTMENSYFIDK